MTTKSTASQDARLVYPALVGGHDIDSGEATTAALPAGTIVRAVVNFATFPPHRSSHGGGWDAVITDPATGFTGRARVRRP